MANVIRKVVGVSVIDAAALAEELAVAVPAHEVIGLQVVGADTDVHFPSGTVLSGPDETAIDTTVSAHDPTNRNQLNRTLLARIEAAADRKIVAAGFTHGGKSFGTTDRQIRHWNLLALDPSSMSFPRVVRTKNRSEAVSLATTADVTDHWEAMRSAILTELEASQVAMQAVLDAATDALARSAAAAYI